MRHEMNPPKPWTGDKPKAFEGKWLLGLDTEYQEYAHEDQTKSYNKILSYQYCLTDLRTMYVGVILLKDGVNDRLSLRHLLSIIFIESGIKPKRFEKKSVYLYAHNTTAE